MKKITMTNDSVKFIKQQLEEMGITPTPFEQAVKQEKHVKINIIETYKNYETETSYKPAFC
ncbi:hypothetical protein [Lonepinella koalarum]|uniref:hypothetical protein n=1 Tax=Lonepinella koalarum TaxID=53417 RepID=UPI001E4792BC|nr:hypothetical protein [Lonepinella koalarum]